MGWVRRIIPPGWLLLAALASGALHRWLPLTQLLHPPVTWLGLVPLVAGLILTSKGFGAFRRAGTPVIPFRRSTALVTTGVYRLTRNPMYLGIALMLGGIAWLLGSVGALLPLPILVWILECGYIRAEEHFLEEIFGGTYRSYKSEVRRWL